MATGVGISGPSVEPLVVGETEVFIGRLANAAALTSASRQAEVARATSSRGVDRVPVNWGGDLVILPHFRTSTSAEWSLLDSRSPYSKDVSDYLVVTPI